MSHFPSKTNHAADKDGDTKTYPSVAAPISQTSHHYAEQSKMKDTSKRPSYFPSITHEEEEINPISFATGNNEDESISVQPGAIAIAGPGWSETTSSFDVNPSLEENHQDNATEDHTGNDNENLVIAAELSPNEDRSVLEERLAHLEEALQSAPVAEATTTAFDDTLTDESGKKRKRCNNCFCRCCLPSAVVCIIVFVIILAIAARSASSSGSTTLDPPSPSSSPSTPFSKMAQQQFPSPSLSPSGKSSGQPSSIPTIFNGCLHKTVRITHICNVPDLDDDIWGRDVTMDIKILIEDELYWPQDVRTDCSSTYGSYQGSCVIPDTSLMGCFPLTNSIQHTFDHPLPDTVSSRGSLKVTIYDIDIFSDDFIDVLVPNSDWYDPQTCEEYTIEAASTRTSARIKMVVTSSDSATPSASPTFTRSPVITPSPTP